MSTKNAKMQIRQGSAAEWATANTLLLLGEWGLESDTGKTKLGDGTTLWNSLGYKAFSANQVASAWVNFNGTGTVAIRDDYNVDSITDGGTGNFTVNIDVDLDDANYSAVATTGNATANLYDTTIHEVSGSRTVGACRFYTSNIGNTPVDPLYVSIQIFGGKA